MMSPVTQGVLSKSTSTSMVSLLYELLTIRQITCQVGALAHVPERAILSGLLSKCDNNEVSHYWDIEDAKAEVAWEV